MVKRLIVSWNVHLRRSVLVFIHEPPSFVEAKGPITRNNWCIRGSIDVFLSTPGREVSPKDLSTCTHLPRPAQTRPGLIFHRTELHFFERTRDFLFAVSHPSGSHNYGCHHPEHTMLYEISPHDEESFFLSTTGFLFSGFGSCGF